MLKLNIFALQFRFNNSGFSSNILIITWNQNLAETTFDLSR